MNANDRGNRFVAVLAVAHASALTTGCESTGPRTAGEYHADQEEARNMRLVGHNDLQARSAYQPVIHQQGNRWIAYIGHHGGVRVNPMNGNKEYNGTSILDVTDPRSPKYLVHLPGAPGGPESGGAQMVRLCNGKDLPKGDRNKVRWQLQGGQGAEGVGNFLGGRDPTQASSGANWPSWSWEDLVSFGPSK